VSAAQPRTHRREDDPLLRGRGTFIDGLRHPRARRCRDAVFVRSIEPHGRLVSIDASAASVMPGVVRRVDRSGSHSMLWCCRLAFPLGNRAMDRPMMAQGVVRFVGEPVAVVLAEHAPRRLSRLRQ